MLTMVVVASIFISDRSLAHTTTNANLLAIAKKSKLKMETRKFGKLSSWPAGSIVKTLYVRSNGSVHVFDPLAGGN